jgi:lysyl-tRNA synthetase class 2
LNIRSPEARIGGLPRKDPRVAERFEVYACGVELANGFGELDRSPRSSAAASRIEMDEKERAMASAIRSTRIS